MKTKMKNLELSELNENELNQINGGVWQYFAIGLAIYGFVNSMAYSAGYAVGAIVRELE